MDGQSINHNHDGEGYMQFRKCYGPLMRWASAKNLKLKGQISKTTFYKEETVQLFAEEHYF